MHNMAKKPKHTTTEEVEDILTNYKGEHPSYKLAMIDWQRNHKEYYDKFKAKIASGDMTIFEEIFSLMQECMPANANKFFNSVTESVDSSDLEQLKATMKPVVEIAETIDSDKAMDSLSVEQKAMASGIASDFAEGDKETKADIMQAVAVLGPAMQLFCLKDYKEFLALFGDKAKAQDPLLYSMCYFFTIDNGGPLLIQAMMGIGAEEQDAEDMMVKSVAAQHVISDSIDHGYTRKKGWLDGIKGLAMDWRIKLGGFLGMRKGKSGPVRKLLLLEDIVPKKTEAVKKIIKEHLSQKDVPAVDIAYILLALQDTELVSDDIEYTTFHYAVQYFMGRDFFLNKAQLAYSDYKNHNFNYKAEGKHNNHAYHMVSMFAEKFDGL